MGKNLLSAFLLFVVSLFYGQTGNLSISVTGTAETCLNNGSLSWTVSNATPGASLSYTVIRVMNPAQTVASTSQNSYAGLPAGTYRVIATQSMGSVSNTAQSNEFIIYDLKSALLFYSVDVSNEICGGDGSFRIDLRTGTKPVKYQLLNADTTVRVEQDSEVFSNLTAGEHRYRVVDACGIGKTGTHVVQSRPPLIDFFSTYLVPLACDKVRVFLTLGGSVKYPVTGTITYQNPETGTTESFTNVGVRQQDAYIDIPYYAGGPTLNATFSITDGCGKSYTFKGDVKQQLFVDAKKNLVACGAESLSFRRASVGLAARFRIEFTSFPTGFNAVASNPSHTSYLFDHYYGAAGTGQLPPGEYNYNIVDECGRRQSGTVTVGVQAFDFYETNNLRECDTGLSSVILQPNTGFVFDTVQITAAPSSFTDQFGPLPFTIPDNWYFTQNQEKKILLSHFPIGRYTVAARSTCQSTIATKVVVLTRGQQQPSYDVQVSVDCSGNYTLFSNVNNFMVQKYFPEVDGWGSTIQNARKDGSGAGYSGWFVTANRSNASYGAGRYRVVNHVGVYYNVLDEQGNLQTFNCERPVFALFTVGQAAVFTEAYAFRCTDNSYTVSIGATSDNTPLRYQIVTHEGNNATVLRDNGSDATFTGLVGGIYYFRVVDNCGNFVTRQFNIAKLTAPEITVRAQCDTQMIELVVNQLDFLNYAWYKTDTPNVILSTTNTLNLGVFNSSKAGSYSVRMSSNRPEACVDTTVETALTETALNQPKSGNGQTVQLNSQDVTMVDLFNYISGEHDMFGSWTETTVPYISNLLIGHRWDASAASAGTYTFRYTVKALCGEATNSTDVTINLFKVCYKPAATNGTAQDTNFGITALGRAGAENDNWPMVRKGGWMALEANALGMVINRVAFDSANRPAGIAVADYVEGMMVYDTTAQCLKIYDGARWSCFTVQSCPD